MTARFTLADLRAKGYGDVADRIEGEARRADLCAGLIRMGPATAADRKKAAAFEKRAAKVRAALPAADPLAVIAGIERANKTERAYASAKLLPRLGSWDSRGDAPLASIVFQGIALRIADGCRYTGDFACEPISRTALIEIHEVKGRRKATRNQKATAGTMTEAARVRIRVAAERWKGAFRFVLGTRQADGTFRTEDVR